MTCTNSLASTIPPNLVAAEECRTLMASLDHNATMPTPRQQEGTMITTRLDHSQEVCPDTDLSSRSTLGLVQLEPDASCSRTFTSRPTAVSHPTQQPLLPGLPDFLALECLARVSLSTISGVSHAWSKLLSDLYFHRLRAHHGTVDLDWVYTLVKSEDGCFRWYAFDPVGGRWHDLPPTPHAMDFQLTGPGCIGVSYSVQCTSTRTKLVMVAALKWKPRDNSQTHDEDTRSRRSRRPILEPALESPLVFDAITSEWTIGVPFRVARKWCACGVADDENLVYVVSGCGRDWDVNVAKSAEVYDVVRNSWRRIAGPTSSKCSSEATAAVMVSDRLYIVSGKGVFAKVGLVYTPATGKWTEMARELREGWTGECASVDGKLFVLDEVKGRLRVYDPGEHQPEWRIFMEDTRLRNLEQLVGRGGKLCGIVGRQSTAMNFTCGQTSTGQLNWDSTRSCTPTSTMSTTTTDYSSLLRIIDVVTKPRRIVDLRVPFGHCVTVQLLSRTLVSHPVPQTA